MMTGFSRLRQTWRNHLVSTLPGQLVIQITDRCNASCPQCGMRRTSDFSRRSLDRREVFRIIDAAAHRNIRAISFTGGEPLLLLDDLCAYLKRAGERRIPWIRTGTNGFRFSGSARPGFHDRVSRLADRLAATPVRNFWISIDSSDPKTHDSMRGFPGLFGGIHKALPLLHERGLFPSANLGINRNLGGSETRGLNPADFPDRNAFLETVYEVWRQAFSRFYDTVIDLGFTIVNACYPMSIEGRSQTLETVYEASSVDRIVRFPDDEKQAVFRALRDTIPSYRSRIRIFTPLTSLNALAGDFRKGETCPYPCQGGVNYWFVDSRTGNTFPCGYRGRENHGRFWNFPAKKSPQPISDCRQCDWECFRDPSEMSGPLVDLLSAPFSLVSRVFSESAQTRLWIRDINYYRACGFFDGRKPPDLGRMEAFASDTGLPVS